MEQSSEHTASFNEDTDQMECENVRSESQTGDPVVTHI